MILYEIQCDRRDRLSLFIFGAASLSLVVACTLLAVDLNLPFDASRLSQFLVLAVAITLLQGYLHQIFLILRRGYVGAVSLRMHQLLFAKDLSMVFFALAMGLTRGWPVLTLACSSALTKLALFWAYWLVNRKGDDAVGTK